MWLAKWLAKKAPYTTLPIIHKTRQNVLIEDTDPFDNSLGRQPIQGLHWYWLKGAFQEGTMTPLSLVWKYFWRRNVYQNSTVGIQKTSTSDLQKPMTSQPWRPICYPLHCNVGIYPRNIVSSTPIGSYENVYAVEVRSKRSYRSNSTVFHVASRPSARSAEIVGTCYHNNNWLEETIQR